MESKVSKSEINVTNSALTQSIINCDAIINKRYMDYIKSYDVMLNNREFGEIKTQNLGVRCLSKIVYDPEENNLDKLTNVFAILNETDARLFILLASSGGKMQVYLGTCDKISTTGMNTSAMIFENSLRSNFPGIELAPVDDSEGNPVLSKIFNSLNDENEIKSIACISGIPSLKTEKEATFVQGLEKIIDGMGNNDYYALFLADPVSREKLETIELDYANLYSTLSVLEQETISVGKSETDGVSESVGKTLTESIGRAVSHSTTHTSSHGEAKSTTKSIANTTSVSQSVGVQAAPMGVGASATTTVGNSTTVGYASTNTKMTMTSDGVTEGETNTINEGISNSTQNSVSKSISITESRQRIIKNRQVMALLALIDEHLLRIRDCKNYGMWNFGIYFLANSETITQMGANICAGIFSGESSGIERRAISQWNRGVDHKEVFDAILGSISRYEHPQFYFPDWKSYFSPTAMVSTKELASGMSLPQKSIPSIPVFEIANFGRSVSSLSRKNGCCIPLGQISHLGHKEEHLSVEVDVNSLSSHTFITGSTGSGKSNAIYKLISELHKNGKKFLVIEPAKGEYKKVFGGWSGVNTFGTNYMETPLLKINPFQFPYGKIHVIEHIDRLIEILNAVWPMYAAMPAMLKDAIEMVYVKYGWNLETSICGYINDNEPVFPDFSDLLQVLPQTIEQSGYSAEVKSNYVGSLVTRVKSLTNGYFRNIFTKEELPERKLFDESTIIDISRVGSAETKALIMGILFMRLQEYRIAQAEETDVALRHVTILEEAHNLLRRSNSSTSGDTGNLQAKSVEMLANSIAEMRTYGEGFIIADQAPGLLDQSVIRNTNTKIILRLPDWDDRNLVGKAANLKDSQIEELARLETGCGAVYQNDWQEAVLCKISLFDSVQKKTFVMREKEFPKDNRKEAKIKLLKAMLAFRMNPSITCDETAFKKAFLYCPEIIQKFNKNPEKNVDACIRSLLQIDLLAGQCKQIHEQNVENWTVEMLKFISCDFNCSEWESSCLRDELLLLLFSTFAATKQVDAVFWNTQFQKADIWREYLK